MKIDTNKSNEWYNIVNSNLFIYIYVAIRVILIMVMLMSV
jgi:hypothetical protein